MIFNNNLKSFFTSWNNNNNYGDNDSYVKRKGLKNL